jgi:1-acyl-sn-glycerol-3-phosphate acyltransferase
MPPQKFFFLIQLSCRLILWICGVQVKIVYQDRLQPGKTYLYMGNHVNIFDIIIMGAYLPTYIVGLEKDTHFHWPIYGSIIKRFGNIPLSQGNTANALESIHQAEAALQSGTSVVIMPEGTRTRTGQMGIFKKGGFHLAIDAKATIMPFTLKGAFEINQKGNWRIKPGQIELIFCHPIEASDYSKETLPELRDRVKSAIASNL